MIVLLRYGILKDDILESLARLNAYLECYFMIGIIENLISFSGLESDGIRGTTLYKRAGMFEIPKKDP